MKTANEALRMLIDSKKRLVEEFNRKEEERDFLEGKIAGIQIAIDILANKY